MLLIDFHTHTKYSRDSLTEPGELAKKAESLGIVFAATDHNSMKAVEDLRGMDAKFIPGEEIRTDKGDLIGLYLNEEIPKKTPFLEAVDLIHSQGGLAYLPHMFDVTRAGVSDPDLAGKVDIIEVYNARSVMQDFNRKAKEFAELHGMLKGAGSDSHFLFEFGSTYTEVPDFELDNPKRLLQALKNGKIVGKPAPIYVKGTTTIVKLWKKITKS